MIEIKAGNELDELIAKIVGVDFFIQDDGLVVLTKKGIEEFHNVKVEAGQTYWYNPFLVSLSTGTAIISAQRLSDHFVLVKDEASKGLWECKLIPGNDPKNWGRGKTPALAICAAILKLKEQNVSKENN